VPQSIDMAPEGFELINEGRIFTPFTRTPVVWKPLAAVNWPPSSYDPATNWMYICATDSLWGATGGDPEYPVEPGALYSGSVVQRFAAPRRGVFAVVDLKTNRIAWRQQWVDQCYSGSVVTAGGLVFVGRSDGRFTALDKANGKKLWEFQTDGGVNAPASVFEHKGTQYIAVLAGGTALAGSRRSDGLWLFSLRGTMESLPRGSADPVGPQRVGPPVGAARPRAANVQNGKDLYTTTCVVCHGDKGQGGTHGGAPLKPDLTAATINAVVTHGRNDMPAFGASFSPEALQDLSAYVLQLIAPAQ
jgi:quinohemoprotein ethanol dehydrogenase